MLISTKGWQVPEQWLRERLRGWYESDKGTAVARHAAKRLRGNNAPTQEASEAPDTNPDFGHPTIHCLSLSQPCAMPGRTSHLLQMQEYRNSLFKMENDWRCSMIGQFPKHAEPVPVDVPVFDVRRCGEAQDEFRKAHLKAWDQWKLDQPESTWESPAVVGRVLREFAGH